MFTLPNFLSASRLILVPVLLVFAWRQMPTPFLVCYGVALLSDALDGWLARRNRQTSVLGAALDSSADFALRLTLPFAAWWLWPDLIRREAWFIAAAIAGTVLPDAFGLLKYRRLLSYHTRLAKLSAVLMGPSLLVLFLDGPAGFFRLSAMVVVITGLEELAITAVSPRWRSNVPSIWHALRPSEELRSPQELTAESGGANGSGREVANSARKLE